MLPGMRSIETRIIANDANEADMESDGYYLVVGSAGE